MTLDNIEQNLQDTIAANAPSGRFVTNTDEVFEVFEPSDLQYPVFADDFPMDAIQYEKMIDNESNRFY